MVDTAAVARTASIVVAYVSVIFVAYAFKAKPIRIVVFGSCEIVV